MLTDDQKAQAQELGLTEEEAGSSLAMHVPLDRYAKQKRDIQAGRDAEHQLMSDFTDAVGAGLTEAYRGGRGAPLPPLDEDA